MNNAHSKNSQRDNLGLAYVMVWIWNAAPKALVLKTWSPDAGIILDGSASFKRWGLAGGSRSLEMGPCGLRLSESPPFPSFCFLVAKGKQLCSITLFYHNILPHHRPRNHEASWPWTETPEPWVKMSLSSFKLFLLGIFQWWKV
jgi:hypothetical protein